jgi:hypothetical protein
MKKLTLANIAQAAPVAVAPVAAVKKKHEKDDTVIFNVRLTAEQRKSIRQIALDLDITAKEVLLTALEEYKLKRGYR